MPQAVNKAYGALYSARFRPEPHMPEVEQAVEVEFAPRKDKFWAHAKMLVAVKVFLEQGAQFDIALLARTQRKSRVDAQIVVVKMSVCGGKQYSCCGHHQLGVPVVLKDSRAFAKSETPHLCVSDSVAPVVIKCHDAKSAVRLAYRFPATC